MRELDEVRREDDDQESDKQLITGSWKKVQNFEFIISNLFEIESFGFGIYYKIYYSQNYKRIQN